MLAEPMLPRRMPGTQWRGLAGIPLLGSLQPWGGRTEVGPGGPGATQV